MNGRKNRLDKNGNPPLNGFSKPGPVSDDLRKFLGLGDDELIARVDVTKAITKYCQENDLQNQEDKRINSILRFDNVLKVKHFKYPGC